MSEVGSYGARRVSEDSPPALGVGIRGVMVYVYETFTVELSRDNASERMGGATIIGQHALDQALNSAVERGSKVESVQAGPDYVLVVLRRDDREPE